MYKMFNNMPLSDLLECRKGLETKIDAAYKKHRVESVSKNIDDYVVNHDKFVTAESDDVLFSGVMADLESLDMAKDSRATSYKTVSKWLTTLDQPYSWDTNY